MFMMMVTMTMMMLITIMLMAMMMMVMKIMIMLIQLMKETSCHWYTTQTGPKVLWIINDERNKGSLSSFLHSSIMIV